MRLGEIKNIIETVLTEDNQIIIENESLFGDQAYLIKNFQEIVNAYDILNDQSWNDVDDNQLKSVVEKYRAVENPVQLDQPEFNILNAYISTLNQKIPYYYSTLESVVQEQDEKIINIKLSEKINSLTGLNELNKRLEKTLKLFNVDGEFEFKGFDKGSDWYVILAAGFYSYQFLVHGLDIAKKFYETREAYYKSKDAELNYKASLKKEEEFSRKELEEYTKRRLDLIIEEKVNEAIEKIQNTNGKTKEELQNQLVRGVKELVKELGEGTEFHLSLNPPEYITGSIGSLRIDYKKVRAIQEAEKKQIEEKNPKILTEPDETNENLEHKE